MGLTDAEIGSASHAAPCLPGKEPR